MDGGRSMMPPSLLLPSTIPAVPHPAMLYQHPAVQYRLICHVSNANFNVLPSHMLQKTESAAVMPWLPSNPQLNKHKGHLQVGRHWDVCLSRQSTSLPLLQLTPSLWNTEVKRCRELTAAEVTVIRCKPRKSATFMEFEVSGQDWKLWEEQRTSGEKKETCRTLEDVISKGADQIGLNRWLWMMVHCNNKSDLQTEIKIKSKYWYSC